MKEYLVLSAYRRSFEKDGDTITYAKAQMCRLPGANREHSLGSAPVEVSISVEDYELMAEAGLPNVFTLDMDISEYGGKVKRRASGVEVSAGWELIAAA